MANKSDVAGHLLTTIQHRRALAASELQAADRLATPLEPIGAMVAVHARIGGYSYVKRRGTIPKALNLPPRHS
jgi:hypothetical protein